MVRTLALPALEMPWSRVSSPALVGRRGEPGEGGELLPVLDVAPGEELEGEEPSGLEPDALEGHELADHGDGGIGGVEKALELKSFEKVDALGEEDTVIPFAEQAFVEEGR